MAAVDLQHAVDDPRHVALDAARAAGRGRVVRVRADVARDAGVALRAGAIAQPVRRQLPGDVARVHRVAARARKRPAAKARRLGQAQVLVGGEARGSVAPEALPERVRRARRRHGCVARQRRHVAGQHAARPKRRPRVEERPQLLRRVGQPLRVALPAQRRALRLADAQRIDDGVRAHPTGTQRGAIPGERRSVPRRVPARRAVARLARDPDVGDVRVEALLLRAGDRLQPRRDAGVVAEDAVHVPDRLVPRPIVVVGLEKHAVQVHPALRRRRATAAAAAGGSSRSARRRARSTAGSAASPRTARPPPRAGRRRRPRAS